MKSPGEDPRGGTCKLWLQGIREGYEVKTAACRESCLHHREYAVRLALWIEINNRAPWQVTKRRHGVQFEEVRAHNKHMKARGRIASREVFV